MARRGRPTTYTKQLAESIMRRMYNGESVRSICAREGMPNRDTVNMWRIRNEEFSVLYARARRAQVEARIEDAAEMLNETPTCEVPDPDGGTSKRVDGAAVQLMRTRAEHARWEASKLLRGLGEASLDYGDKIDNTLSGPGGQPIQAEITVKFVKSAPVFPGAQGKHDASGV